MERYFCRDKKDYCDKDLACRDCEFAKGSGVINGVYVEDVLSTLFGDDYNLDRLKELVKADREGRCAVLNTGYTETAGGKALEQAMYLCSVTNNEVTRYTADAIAEKFIREERFCEAMKERENDDLP